MQHGKQGLGHSIMWTMACMGALFVAAPPARADAGIVREANGCAYATIGAAITASIPGDTILIDGDPLYFESGWTVEHDLTLASSNLNCQDEIGTAIVDGGGARILHLVSGPTSPTLTLRRLHLHHGSAPTGGVVLVDDASLILDRTTVSEGTAVGAGGCLAVYGGSLTLRNLAKAVGCDAGTNGGAILVADGELIVENTVAAAEDSHAGLWGGGIALVRSAAVLESPVTNNSADLGGGGLFASESTVDLFATVGSNRAPVGGGVALSTGPSEWTWLEIHGGGRVTNNEAELGLGFGGDGGGIWAVGDPQHVPAQILVHGGPNGGVTSNVAAGSGGGVAAIGKVAIDLRDEAEVADNQAGALGGGIFFDGLAGIFESRDSVIAGNTALGNGGGLYLDNSVPSILENTVLESNTAVDSDGGGMFIAGAHTVSMSSAISCNPFHDRALHRYCSEAWGNEAARGGGVFVGEHGQLTVLRSGLIANEAAAGSAVYVASTGTAALSNSLLADGTDAAANGALHVEGAASLDLVTIAGNTAHAARFEPGSVGFVSRSILWEQNGGLSAAQAPNPATVVPVCNTLSAFNGALLPGSNNDFAAPLLQGPPYTAIFRPYFLHHTSPALERCAATVELDLMHRVRLPSVPTNKLDRGAFERGGLFVPPP